MTVREAEKAGTWYRGDPAALAREVDASVSEAASRFGDLAATPGTTPAAAVVPHAGLAYSGAVAAQAYRLIRSALASVDCFVIFGACHRARLTRPAIWPDGWWDTPLGPVRVDEAVANLLVDNGVGDVDRRAHIGDNAIELQMPFIARLFPEAAVAPVAMSPNPLSWQVGEKAFGLMKDSGKTVVALASTDLTHYGDAFGLVPAGVGPAAIEWTRDNDARFLAALTEMRLDDIVRVAVRDASACGAGAAAAAAGWAKAAGCGHGRLLAHTNSHEIRPSGVADHLVGYASVAYEAPERGLK